MVSNKGINHIGILTSGGDSPGMNAAIRGVVRAALHSGIQVTGIQQGYLGLVNTYFTPLNARSVANIIQRGGTILQTERCLEFHQSHVRRRAVENLRKAHIDGLICIGGDGSMHAAHLLWLEHSLPVIAIPGTIDNDIFGTDLSIGFDTAVNTALESLDRIRDTAASHNRLFIVEVMGRNSGFIALSVGLAAGAEHVFTPEKPVSVDVVIDQIKKGIESGKKSSILVAAEGQKPGRAYDLAEAIRKKSGFEAKVCVLGHIQRGGTPTATDRNLASRMAARAVYELKDGRHDDMVALKGGEIELVPLKEIVGKHKPISEDLLELVQILSQ